MSINFLTCVKTPSGDIRTPKAKMSFPELFTPSFDMGKTDGKKKYRLTLIIPKGADLTLLKEAASAAVKAHYGDKIPSNLKSPFLKGEDQNSEYIAEGDIVIRSTTTTKPGLISANLTPITDESEIYGGRWCVATLRPFIYEIKDPKTGSVMNRGVSLGLQHVQALDHDTPFGRSRARAEDEFAPITGADGAKAANVDDLF